MVCLVRCDWRVCSQMWHVSIIPAILLPETVLEQEIDTDIFSSLKVSVCLINEGGQAGSLCGVCPVDVGPVQCPDDLK